MKKTLTFIGVIVWILLIAGVVYVAKTYKSIDIPSTSGEIPAVGEPTELSVAEGFEISLYAKDIPGARVIVFGPTGEILVSQPGEGTISAIRDTDNNGTAEDIFVVVSGLNKPHGMAFRCTDPVEPTKCDLYVAETNALSVFTYDAKNFKATGKKKLLDLPSGGGHSTRTLLFMPSPDHDTLLISIGSSCNVCEESDANRASILSYDILTGVSAQYARGLRNSVFMEIHPVTGAIWATEMGRDGLGDDIPPDEVNIISRDGNYGWPICYGKNIHDGDFDDKTYIRNPCMTPFETPSHLDIQAHSAPLGLAFAPEEGWPEEYWYDIFVAYHGSWNRSEPTGYKVVRARLDSQGDLGIQNDQFIFEDFITGWLKPDGTKIGRPVDIKALPGGTMYISDDEAGAIYRVTRK